MEALQDQTSKWQRSSLFNLRLSETNACTCLSYTPPHRSPQITAYAFFSSIPDGGCDTGGLSFFHAIPTELDSVKKKGTSTLDKPTKPTLKTPHPAPANCTNIVMLHEPFQLSVFFQSIFVLYLTCLYMLTVCYRYLSASTGKTPRKTRRKREVGSVPEVCFLKALCFLSHGFAQKEKQGEGGQTGKGYYALNAVKEFHTRMYSTFQILA